MWKMILWFREAFKGLFRNLTLNLLAVVMSTICLCLLAGGIILGLNAKHFATEMENNMGITVYLKPDVTHYDQIESDLNAIGGVKELSFTTKDEAYEKMKRKLGKNDSMLTELGYNPLPAHFFLKLTNPKDIPKVAKTIETWGISSKVRYGEDFVKDLFLLTDKAKQVAFYTIIASGIVAAGMIFIAIKINIFNRNKEIEIKDLIGAGMFNIRIPFILEALILSLTASGAVILMVWVMYDRTMSYVTGGIFSNYLPLGELMMKLIPFLLVVAIAIALIGSFISTQRYLKRH